MDGLANGGDGVAGDDSDDAYSDDDLQSDWTLEEALAWLQLECAEDSTGLDAACDLAVLAESCLAGDSTACVDYDIALAGYDYDDDESDDDDESELASLASCWCCSRRWRSFSSMRRSCSAVESSSSSS